MTSPESPLHHLASLADVTIDWVDAWNEPQVVADDDLTAVLEALLSRPLTTEAAIDAAISEVANDVPAVEPVVVAWDGRLGVVPVSVPVSDAEVVLEDGSVMPADVTAKGVSFDGVLPIGYHQLKLNGGSLGSHLFSAPRLAHPAPTGVLGLISPAYSLRRSTPDRGIGSIGDLRALADVCHESGVEVVGTLPMLAAFPDHPSPYAPASRRAWNELFVDFDHIPDYSFGEPERRGDRAWVDYEGTGDSIRQRLASYAEHVSRTPRLRSAVDAFLRREPEMARYARFRAVADDHGRNWRAWHSNPTPDPVRVAYHETVQWLMDSQLRRLSSDLEARGQYLYMDLPIGCHPDGFDIWDTPDLFAPASLGAPPDTLFVGGQDWGLPASIPKASRLEGHLNYRKAIARQLSVAGLLRIDHVMGIHRTWWVPHGSSAKQGAYVMHPTDEMFAIICIESVRAESGVVGENLGTVPPEIRIGLDEHELLGMAIAQDGVTTPKPTDLVALSSHDTPAFAAWWKEQDIDDLVDLGVFDDERAEEERTIRHKAIDDLQWRFGTQGPEPTRDALMAWMSSTPAAIALLNLDDLLMEERRQNIPGTDWERPNWRLRHARTVDDMASDEGFTGRLRGFRQERPSEASATTADQGSEQASG